MRHIFTLVVSVFLISCGTNTVTENRDDLGCAGRFCPGVVPIPEAGYVDSVTINANGDSIYFAYSYLSPWDFLKGSTQFPGGPVLPGQTVGLGLDWNTDLYVSHWNGLYWSQPTNLGSAIDGSNVNSLANECCIWVSPDELEIIFYRDNLGLPALGPSGNYITTRATTSSPWNPPVLLPSVYGMDNQSSSDYRHDIQYSTYGNLYLWEHDLTVSPPTSTLLLGRPDGNGGFLPPTLLPGLENLSPQIQSRPWVSHDELTLLFNDQDPTTGNSTLQRSTRTSALNNWGAPTTINTDAFADPKGATVWGEPSFSSSENFMIFDKFDTSQPGWTSRIGYAPGCPRTTNSYNHPIWLN